MAKSMSLYVYDFHLSSFVVGHYVVGRCMIFAWLMLEKLNISNSNLWLIQSLNHRVWFKVQTSKTKQSAVVIYANNSKHRPHRFQVEQNRSFFLLLFSVHQIEKIQDSDNLKTLIYISLICIDFN